MIIKPSTPKKIFPLSIAVLLGFLWIASSNLQGAYFSAFMPFPLLEPFTSRKLSLREGLLRYSAGSKADWTQKASLYSEAVVGTEKLGLTPFEIQTIDTGLEFEFFHRNFQTSLFAATRAGDKDIRKGIRHAVKKMELVAASQAEVVYRVGPEGGEVGEQMHFGTFKGEVCLFEMGKGRYEIKIKNEFAPQGGEPVIYLEHFVVPTRNIEQIFSAEKMNSFVRQFTDRLMQSRLLIPDGMDPGFRIFAQDFFSELLKNMPLLLHKMIEEYPIARERYLAELKVHQLESRQGKSAPPPSLKRP